MLAYNLKLWMAGLGGALFVPLSLAALVMDVLFRRTRDPDGLARRVLRASAEFEATIDIHGSLTDVRVRDDRAADPPAVRSGATERAGR